MDRLTPAPVRNSSVGGSVDGWEEVRWGTGKLVVVSGPSGLASGSLLEYCLRRTICQLSNLQRYCEGRRRDIRND